MIESTEIATRSDRRRAFKILSSTGVLRTKHGVVRLTLVRDIQQVDSKNFVVRPCWVVHVIASPEVYLLSLPRGSMISGEVEGEVVLLREVGSSRRSAVRKVRKSVLSLLESVDFIGKSND